METDSNHGVGPLTDLLPDYIVIKRVFIAEDHTVVEWVSRCFLFRLGRVNLLFRCDFGLLGRLGVVHVLSLPLLQLRKSVLPLSRAALLQL